MFGNSAVATIELLASVYKGRVTCFLEALGRNVPSWAVLTIVLCAADSSHDVLCMQDLP